MLLHYNLKKADSYLWEISFLQIPPHSSSFFIGYVLHSSTYYRFLPQIFKILFVDIFESCQIQQQPSLYSYYRQQWPSFYCKDPAQQHPAALLMIQYIKEAAAAWYWDQYAPPYNQIHALRARSIHLTVSRSFHRYFHSYAKTLQPSLRLQRPQQYTTLECHGSSWCRPI